MRDSKLNRRDFIQKAAAAFAGISLALVIAAPLCHATGTEPQTAWDKMTPEEQAAIEKRWQTFQALSPEAQAELRHGLERYKALSETEQKQVGKAFGRWKALSSEQRNTLKAKFLKWKDLTAEQQTEIRAEVRKAVVDPAKSAK